MEPLKLVKESWEKDPKECIETAIGGVLLAALLVWAAFFFLSMPGM